MNDSVYELATRVVQKAREEAEQKAGRDFVYPRLAGMLEAILKWIPENNQNINFLKGLLNEK